MVSFIFLSTLFQVYGLVYIPLYMMKVTFQHDWKIVVIFQLETEWGRIFW